MSAKVGGGGEWTALRELADRWINWPGDGLVVLERHDNGRELKATLEALAAAAPADTSVPKVVGDKFVVANGERRFLAQALSRLDDVAPPPQDGQGAELQFVPITDAERKAYEKETAALGPPRGGSSSDLADSISPSAAKLLRREAAKFIHAAIERIASHSTDKNAVNEAVDALEQFEFWDFSLGAKQSLPEAIAGNASAPVGEKRQPSGEPCQWLIYFADVDHDSELFVGPLAEQAARARFKEASANWDCTLFCTAVEARAGQPSGVQQEQHLDPWDEPHTVKTPVGEHGPSCEFIKDGKGTCGPDCGQPSGVGEPLHVFKEFENAVKYLQEHGYSDWDGTANGQEITLTGCANMMRQYKRDLPLVAAREVGEGLREAANRAYCNYIDKLRTPECLGHEQKLKEGSFGIAELVAHRDAAELLGRHRAFAEAAALAAPATKPELTSRDCICPTTCDGPEYNLKILPNCPWHSRAPKPAPPAEPLNVKEYLDLALRIQRVGAEHPYKLEHAGVNQGMWVCHCGEVLGDQPIDEIDAVAEQHISKFVAELVRRAAERKP